MTSLHHREVALAGGKLALVLLEQCQQCFRVHLVVLVYQSSELCAVEVSWSGRARLRQECWVSYFNPSMWY